jgi:hypothetical protein
MSKNNPLSLQQKGKGGNKILRMFFLQNTRQTGYQCQKDFSIFVNIKNNGIFTAKLK